MKIGIIGAGNMGGAIARGLASSSIINATDITVCSPNSHKELDALTAFNPAINVSTDNAKAIYHTDLILVAVKPWLLDSVLEPLIPKIDYKKQAIISIVAGFTLDHLANLAKDYTNSPVVFRLIPNTAIAVRQSMTFIAAKNATQ
ncbi:MAG: NAD(P)-binding domain-containing protein, partial [Muribaculaceae bacterium]